MVKNTEQRQTLRENGRLPCLRLKAGGPFTMEISDRNSSVTVNDILIGDVWLCNGQSNMVHQLDIHDVLYADEIATANNPEIRHFKIPTTTSISGPKEDLMVANGKKL